MASNTVNHHQIADVPEMGKDDIPELVDNDTSKKRDNNTEQYIQFNEGLETIPEEAKKENFIETMPTMIQTHLIMCKDWDMVNHKIPRTYNNEM